MNAAHKGADAAAAAILHGLAGRQPQRGSMFLDAGWIGGLTYIILTAISAMVLSNAHLRT